MSIAGVAKVQPSKDFLRPLCQILDAHLCIKYPKFTSIMWSLCKKMKGKKFAARNKIFEWNLARQKKSMATPGL